MRIAGNGGAKGSMDRTMGAADRLKRQRQEDDQKDSKMRGRDQDPDQRMTDLEEKMEQLSANIGEGNYQQPLLTALAQSVTTNARDIANLQAVVTKNYEISPNSNYIQYPKDCMKTFGEHCRNLRGKTTNTGHPKNYALIGLVAAMMEDEEATAEEKELANKLVFDKVINSNKDVNLQLAKEVQHVCSFCQVVQTPKKGFINIAVFPGPDNELLMKAFDRIFMKIGTRQWDPPPPKPVNKDIRKWISDQRTMDR
jgi:hypothetical protein